MKKVITFLFLINMVAAVAWFNYQVYHKFSADKVPMTTQYQEPKENNYLAIGTAQQFFQNNIILELLLKRM